MSATASTVSSRGIGFDGNRFSTRPIITATEESPATDSSTQEERPRADLGPLLLALVVALLLIGTWFDGAFDVADWAPIALIALAAVAVLGLGGRFSVSAHGFGLLLALFGIWTLVSTLWSDSPSAGVESGARYLFYGALALAVVATLPRRVTAVQFGRFVLLGYGALAGVTLVALLVAGKDLILAGRLDTPVGYRNGAAAVMAMAAVAAICVAAARTTNPLARSGAFALGVAALGLAYLSQSRGVVLGFAAGTLIAVLLGPERLRRVGLTLIAGGLVAAVSQQLLEPYDAFLDRRFTSAAEVESAALALLLAAGVGFAIMYAIALLDSGLRLSVDAKTRLRAVAVVVLVLIGTGGAVAGVAEVGNPISYADEKLQEFKQLEPAGAGGTRLGSTSGQRYDLWQIAIGQFEDAPLLGGGEGSFPAAYYRERSTDRNLTFAHSLPLSVLGDNGLIGLLLLAGALAVLAVVVVRRWPHVPPADRRVASALLGAGAVLVVQSGVDWLWSIAALAGLAVVTLAVALRIVTAPELPPTGDERPRAVAALPWRAGAVLGAILIACLFASATYLRVARNVQDEPQRTLDAGATAKSFAPWDLDAYYLRAGALESLGRTDAARDELLAALDREPNVFVTMALLGDLETRAGDPGAAQDWYARAAALNPRDAGLQTLANGG